MAADKSSRIAELNDQLRAALTQPFALVGVRGRIMMTCGVSGLDGEIQRAILERVASFDGFCESNDPHSEHDFGAFDMPGPGKIFWKIDYYDPSLQWGSEDPSDPELTMRVLTVMLAEEY